MKPKLKPNLDLESIQQSLLNEAADLYNQGLSLRAVAKKMGFSMVKVRKMLITAGVYKTEISTAVIEAHSAGMVPEEIARKLSMSLSNVYLYLPYMHIIYNMEERSVDADRQARYRKRKKEDAAVSEPDAGLSESIKTINAILEIKEETTKRIGRRNETVYIAINKRLRNVLPKNFCSEERDPSEDMKIYGLGMDPFNLPDPAFNIWHADLAVKGRGKNRKEAMVIENARCGYSVVIPVPKVNDAKDGADGAEAAIIERAKVDIIDAICKAMIEDFYPSDKVKAVLGNKVEFVKGGRSASCGRVTELCTVIEKNVETDPMDFSRSVLNSGTRKFGNSPLYRYIEDAVAECLGMSDNELNEWRDKRYRSYFKA